MFHLFTITKTVEYGVFSYVIRSFCLNALHRCFHCKESQLCMSLQALKCRPHDVIMLKTNTNSWHYNILEPNLPAVEAMLMMWLFWPSLLLLIYSAANRHPLITPVYISNTTNYITVDVQLIFISTQLHRI